MNINNVSKFFQQDEYSHLDRHFARFMLNIDPIKIPSLYLAAGLVCHHADLGDTCLELSNYAGKKFHWKSNETEHRLSFLDIDEWISKLKHSTAVGSPGEKTPLILDESGKTNRLYLLRYWEYENQLAQFIKNRIQQPIKTVDKNLLQEGLNRLFPDSHSETDWQKEAAHSALTHSFSVISGGPGTGKTTTVIKIIILLLEQFVSDDFHLALVAPTGKAAMRLKESIISSKQKLAAAPICSKAILERIPEETYTLHRLLGPIRHSPYFRHNKETPLPYDCVIVDEASMVDLALMSKLTSALRPNTSLILLGDENQLSSVESGSVLGDICKGTSNEINGGSENSRLNIIRLQKSYRFNNDEGVGKLSRLINSGKGEESLKLIQQNQSSDLQWSLLPDFGSLQETLKTTLIKEILSFIQATTPAEAFRRFQPFRILCALKNGPYGALNINVLIERLLVQKGTIQRDETWYSGRPVMITRNDYSLQLFNGDIGLVLPDSDDNDILKVFFETGPNQYRKFLPARLPEHETVFAMTIHKSQGSEFDKILIILPDQDSPVLTRELIYTGLTRAKKQVSIWGVEEIFVRSIKRKIERRSGLVDQLS